MTETIEMDRWLCEDSLAYFTEQAFPILEPKRKFIPGFHIDAICEHLEACFHGDIMELLINMPPRHMKSLLVSVCFPAWVWTKAPERRFLSASYAKSLSVRDAMKTRRLIQSAWFQARWGNKFQLTGDQNAKQRFENTATGLRVATSVGGEGTGEGGDFISVDDPHKVSESESPAHRKQVLDWWDNEMSSRANDPKKNSKIITMQRVHQEDLSGHVLKQGGYFHLMLPAEYESARKCITQIGWEDPRCEEGELLWRERFDKLSLDKLKSRMGSRTSAGQLQQRPSPEEGNIVKRSWWKYYRELPEGCDKHGLSADLTFKDGEKNDFVAMGTWARKGANKYLTDLINDKLEFTEQIKSLVLMLSQHPEVTAKWIEDAANAAALVSVVKKTIPGVIPVPPRGSKIARAESIAPQIEAGNIFLPDPTYEKHIKSGLAKKVLELIEQWAVFPNGTHDDMVDMTSLGVSQLTSSVNYDMTLVSIEKESLWIGR